MFTIPQVSNKTRSLFSIKERKHLHNSDHHQRTTWIIIYVRQNSQDLKSENGRELARLRTENGENWLVYEFPCCLRYHLHQTCVLESVFCQVVFKKRQRIVGVKENICKSLLSATMEGVNCRHNREYDHPAP